MAEANAFFMQLRSFCDDLERTSARLRLATTSESPEQGLASEARTEAAVRSLVNDVGRLTATINATSLPPTSADVCQRCRELHDLNAVALQRLREGICHFGGDSIAVVARAPCSSSAAVLLATVPAAAAATESEEEEASVLAENEESGTAEAYRAIQSVPAAAANNDEGAAATNDGGDIPAAGFVDEAECPKTPTLPDWAISRRTRALLRTGSTGRCIPPPTPTRWDTPGCRRRPLVDANRSGGGGGDIDGNGSSGGLSGGDGGGSGTPQDENDVGTSGIRGKGALSSPPTPEICGLRATSVLADAAAGRESSGSGPGGLATPKPNWPSPLKTPANRSLLEASMRGDLFSATGGAGSVTLRRGAGNAAAAEALSGGGSSSSGSSEAMRQVQSAWGSPLRASFIRMDPKDLAELCGGEKPLVEEGGGDWGGGEGGEDGAGSPDGRSGVGGERYDSGIGGGIGNGGGSDESGRGSDLANCSAVDMGVNFSADAASIRNGSQSFRRETPGRTPKGMPRTAAGGGGGGGGTPGWLSRSSHRRGVLPPDALGTPSPVPSAGAETHILLTPTGHDLGSGSSSGNGGNYGGSCTRSGRCYSRGAITPARTPAGVVAATPAVMPAAAAARAGTPARRAAATDEEEDSKTPELKSPPRAAAIMSVDDVRRRASQRAAAMAVAAEAAAVAAAAAARRPLRAISEAEWGPLPKFLTMQVTREELNVAVVRLNDRAAAAASPVDLRLSQEETDRVIDRGSRTKTVLLSLIHLKRLEMHRSAGGSERKTYQIVLPTDT